MLYRSYEQTSTNREDTSLDAFPHSVASLMQRYREGRQIEGYQVQMNNYWTIPGSLMTAIRRRFCVATDTTERFACPLNFNAAMTSYYSSFPEDRALEQYMTHTHANGLGRHMHTLSTHQRTCRRQSDGLWHQQNRRTCQVSQCLSLRCAPHHTNSFWITQWYITLQPYLEGPFNSGCPQHGMMARTLEHIQSMTYSFLQWPTRAGLIHILMRGSSVRACKK